MKKKNVKEDEPVREDVVVATLSDGNVVAEANDLARELYDKGRYGEPFAKKKFRYSMLEALHLVDRSKMEVKSGRKALDFDAFLKKAMKLDKEFWVRYSVFRDMRNRGYIVKTALKFGADFRVYDRGIKPGEDHAKWVVFPVHEASTLTWYDFSAKNRVAHSTRKRLLLGVVDDEGDVTYYEVKWVRP